jgi:arylsulfatase A-like enzyme
MAMNRRKFLKYTGQGILAGSIPLLMNNGCVPKKPVNILFIMSDDHAANAISAYGSKINQTPNIDRIAKDGVLFRESFCTTSICAPSRAVLLTGKYGHLNGQVDNGAVFDGSQMTFPKLLQAAGYQTAMIGKWHLKSDPTGFDYWNILPGQGQYYNPDFIEMGEKKQITGYATDITTDIAISWLDSRDSEKPFCMLLHHKAPHRNFMPGPKHLTMYDGVDIPMPETFFDNYQTRSAAAREQEMEVSRHTMPSFDLKLPVQPQGTDETEEERMDREFWLSSYNRMNDEQKKNWDEAYGPKNEAFLQAGLTGRELAEWKYQRYIKDYLRCVASVDDNVGRVLDYLDQHGLRENTLVIYTSDQGFYLGEHGWFDKRFMYEESLRMPMLMSMPGTIRTNSVSGAMSMNLDFAPTILDFAGVTIPLEMQGVSLRPILLGNDPAGWRESIYYHYYEYPGWHMVKRHYGVRTQRYKLIHYYYNIDAWEMYDLQEDPHELNNICDDPGYASVRSQLEKRLAELRAHYGDSDDNKFMPQKEMTVEHLALNCPVTFNSLPAPKYRSGAARLTDGKRSPRQVLFISDYSLWAGWQGNDFDVTIDLQKVQKIGHISAGFLHQNSNWIFPPATAEALTSIDGIEFTPAGKTEYNGNLKSNRVTRRNYPFNFAQRDARYIRVKAKNIAVCPDWHAAAGKDAWLMVDEIIVKGSNE